MAIYKDQHGKRIQLGDKLGQGGEASVYRITGEPDSVVKIYNPEKRAYYEPRLVEMVAHPPEDQTRNLKPPHISIAWAERLVYENSHFIGYTMPVIKKAPDIYKVYSPTLRAKELPSFNWRLIHHTACNLAIAVNAYHAAGYVIGDLNSKNVKVHQNAMVTMVDTDSIQVRTAAGKILRCPVGVPDFTSPELLGKQLDQVDRDIYHDAFALSVMIFLLLMEGYHPFSGAPTNPAESVDGPVYQYCIKKGIFPFSSNRSFSPPKFAPEYKVLYPEVQALFNRCFIHAGEQNRTNRPLPLEWYKVLSKAENELIECGNGHWYFPSSGQCPWCKRSGKIAAIPHPVQKPAQPTRPRPVQPAQPRPVTAQQPGRAPQPYMPAAPQSAPARQIAQAVRPVKSYLPIGQNVKQRKWVWLIPGCIVALIAICLFAFIGSQTFLSGEDGTSGISLLNGLLASFEDISSEETTSTSIPEPTALPSCPNAPDLRFRTGDVVYVATGQNLRGHSEPSLSTDNIIVRYSYGNQLEIIDGPVCVQSGSSTAYWFWQVEDSNGSTSWVAEGDEEFDYLKK